MTSTEPKRTGRPPLTSRAALLAAARDHGFVGLSVGVVTGAVGRSYSSFYRHYKSHDELAAALIDETLADATWPDRGPWRQHLRDLGHAIAGTADANPGMSAAIRRQLLHDDGEPQHLAQARSLAETILAAAGVPAGAAETAVDTVITLALADPPHRDGIELVLDGVARVAS